MSGATLLDAALAHHPHARPAIPVDAGKRPLVEWSRWRTQPQTEAELRSFPWDRAHGIGILTWPASNLIVLDFDGPHAEAAWCAKGITLPETARTKTRSGGMHLVFRVPEAVPRHTQSNGKEPRRKVRVVVAECDCTSDGHPHPCGVDLLLNGYFIVPPTPGYTEDPERPLDPATIGTIPQAVLDLARDSERPRSRSEVVTREADWFKAAMHGPIPQGQRNDTASRLAGLLLAKGMSPDYVTVTLTPWAEHTCAPPMDPRELCGTVDSIAKREAVKGRSAAQKLRLVTVTDLLARDYASRVDLIGGGILPPEGGLLLAGPSGAGKSLLSLELALALASGRPFLGLYAVAAPQSVLVIQQENAQAEVQKRLARMIEARGWTALDGGLTLNEPGSFLDLETEPDWDAIAEAIGEVKATVLVLDPLSTFHARDENDNTRMRKVLDRVTGLCRQAHCAAAVVHHFGKPQAGQSTEDTRHGIRGASSILDWADTAVTLTEKKHEELILRRLEFVKLRNGKPIRPLLLQRDPENLLHTVVAEEGVLCSPARVRAILRDLGGEVDSKSALVSEIMKQTGASQPTAYRVVDEAVAGKLIREARGEGKRVRLEVA